ncbi:MAG: hypothetical protein ABI587_01555 [Gemmatimonadales bacterium]
MATRIDRVIKGGFPPLPHLSPLPIYAARHPVWGGVRTLDRNFSSYTAGTDLDG